MSIQDNTLQDNIVNEFKKTNLHQRHRLGKVWYSIFLFSTLIGIIALSALLLNITNDSFGLIAFKYKIQPGTLFNGRALESLTKEELNTILENNTSANRYRTIFKEKSLEDTTQQEMVDLVIDEVAKPQVIKTWSYFESITNKDEIRQEILEKYPDAELKFRSWITPRFIQSAQNSNPLWAGIKTAILGSLWIIFVTMVIAVPIGVGAAIYLEEYANHKLWINQAIQTNINNLAAVPSIIYGILGLTIFVRAMAPITSGSVFGFGDSSALNGRTILSGAFTLAILVLPLIILNTQEALRSVPSSLREASYGLGATKWQTVRSHVIPNSISGILTGTILAISRAFGETAPLIVVGVSTYMTVNPANIFSQFTTLPAQIYQWTARPQDIWRNLSAAAIIVLMVVLLALNATAILLRNKYSRKY